MNTPYGPEPDRPEPATGNACDPIDGLPDVDPAWFFPRDSRVEADRTRAKNICRRCPLANQRACFMGALERGEKWGIWGGVDFREAGREAAAIRATGKPASRSTEARRLRRKWEMGAAQ